MITLDVWNFTFNSHSPSVRFVDVRDSEKKIVYDPEGLRRSLATA